MTLTVEWPHPVPYKPLRDPMELSPQPQFQAVEMDGGWTDRTRMFSVTPVNWRVDIEMSLSQFKILMGWWNHTIFGGAREFRMPFWDGWQYVDTLARMGVEPWRGRMPDGDRWVVSVEIEILDMPTLTAQETAALQLVELYGQANAVTLLGDLNTLVHTTWPEALAP